MPRLLFGLLLFFGLTTNGALYAQSILDREVSLRLRDASLADALFTLAEEAETGIIFSSEILPDGPPLELRLRRRSFRDALDRLLADTGLTYSIVGRQVVLERAPTPVFTEPVTLSGYFENADSGERLIGATVYEPLSGRGTVSNEYGFYSLTLPPATYRLQFSYLGYQTAQQTLELTADRDLIVKLDPSILLREVVITPPADSLSLRDQSAGLGTIPGEIIDRVPTVGGENDVVRTAQLLAGVQSGADGFGGLSVRGGGVDQNLYLLDGVPVYNALHSFGVYSVYNSDAVSSVQLLRGDFPARYGGRLSSVLDVRIREGNMRRFAGQVDVGLTSVSLWAEGPIVRDRASFFVSARRSLFDFYSRPYTRNRRAARGESGEFGYYFYDFNAKVNWRLDERNSLFVSAYQGGDLLEDERGFSVAQADTLFNVVQGDQLDWGNSVAVLRWTHQAGPQLFLKTMAAFSRYRFNNEASYDIDRSVRDSLTAQQFFLYQYGSNNRDLIAKFSADYLPNDRHYLRFGVEGIAHQFQPGVIDTSNANGLLIELEGSFVNSPPLRSEELNFFAEDDWQIGSRWLLNGGLRLSTVFVNDTRYTNLEPRLTATYRLQRSILLCASAGRVVQPLHLLSNSGIGLPLDLWVSSTRRVPPQRAVQYSLRGDYQPNARWHFHMEGYYKRMRGLITFEEGLISSINAFNWQDRILSGTGMAYGVEFQLTKKMGNTTGWINYTYARSFRTYTELNDGEAFPFRFDRPHSFKTVMTHSMRPQWTVSATFQYSSGMPFTIPLQDLLLIIPGTEGQTIVQIPSVRNSLRLPANHRLDVSTNYKPNARIRWTFGVYNLYNRRNPIYVDIRSRINAVTGDPERVFTQTTLLPIFPYLRFQYSR